MPNPATPHSPIPWNSNRSASHAALKDGAMALEDALSCMGLRGDWAKGPYRVGKALEVLGDREGVSDCKEGFEGDKNRH